MGCCHEKLVKVSSSLWRMRVKFSEFAFGPIPESRGFFRLATMVNLIELVRPEYRGEH